MTRWLKKAAVTIAVSMLLTGAGCKKKDDAAAQQNAGTDTAQQQQAAANDKKPDETAVAKTDDGKAPQKIEGCNSDFKVIPESNTTLTAACSPYTLSTELSVDGWDLTIEPGVELRFNADAALVVGYGKQARLTAKGTAEKPIRFVSGSRKEAGSWRNISLHGNAGGSEISYAVVEHAGQNDEPAIQNDAKDVKISHTKIVGAKKVGYLEKNEGKTVEFAENDFSEMGGDEIAVEMNFVSTPSLKANKFPAGKVIALNSKIDTDLSIPNAGVPYRVLQQVEVEAAEEGKTANVTIAPGTIFQMGEGAEWEFGYSKSGGLKAIGTAEQPIVWTRFGEAEKGSWKGLEFHGHSKAPQIVFAKIEFAGENSGQAIRYNGVKALGKIQHVTVSKSKGYGLYSFNEEPEPFEAFSDNTFEDIDGATLYMQTDHANKLGPNNKFPANGSIQLERDVKKDLTLTAQSAPYVVLQQITVEGDDDTRPATITLEPGATVKFGPDGKFSLGYSHPGGIKAVGAADKPITFTAATENWKGIDVNTKGKVQVENAVFSKLSDDEPAISLRREAAASSIKAVKFEDVKIPVRDCTGKATLVGVKASKDGC